ncbi:hypothetical protein G6F56_014539 [Rhizopus delemar]|nr:hypothetical protein G6F56_014539 [Rhizopus delemar]
MGHGQRGVVPAADGAVEPSLRSASAIRAKRSRAWLGSTEGNASPPRPQQHLAVATRAARGLRCLGSIIQCEDPLP